ncbi:MAG TPA: ParB/RepB/Spo0J family partition protein, partial [Nitrososphaerales archaeon]|nr:ParB/RepB/Spo0J family partition protein [Nitrososphaerales archaeon]
MREQLGDLNELCASIRSHGMLQPIIVRPKGQNFEVICGNRRYEACRRLMKRHVDCIVRDLTDQDAYEIALVENVQRNTLSVLEEASAYKKYIKEFGWGGVTDLSTKIGKSEEYVSHRISLLELPEEIIMKVASGKLNASQAQELVWIKEPEIREELAGLLDQEDLSVKQIREVRKRFENQTCSEPDYENNSKETLRTLTKESSDKKVVEEAILGLRVALVRVDSSISKAL